MEATWSAMAAEVLAMLEAEGFPPARRAVERLAALRYHGQAFELTIPVPDGALDLAALGEAFGQEHEKTYGHRAGPEEPIDVISLGVIARGIPERAAVPDEIRVAVPEETTRPEPRRAYFGPRHGWHDTPVLFRSDLATPVKGPAIVEEYGSTCVVPPGFAASLDGYGNIILQKEAVLF
jgi:N-methylhydantoinase A